MIRGHHTPFAITARHFSALFALVALVLIAPASEASIITMFGGASGPGLASMSFNEVVTTAIGNDDVVGASPNYVSINQKAFGAVDYIDMVFVVEDIGVPSTEYAFTEGVSNGTGTDWIGYQILLGFGTGASFVESSLGDGLDFDAPDFNSPIDFTPFATVTLGEDVYNAVDGLFSSGAFHVFSFSVDVPIGITEFTLRQIPREASVATSTSTWSQVKALY